MKTLTTQLQNLFATGQMHYCGLYAFQLANNSGNLYYASGDVDISLVTADSGGDPYWNNQYLTAGGSTGPYFDRKDNKAKMHVAVGLQVDTLVFDVIPASATIDGAPFLTAVREGVFDGAELTYLGAYWPGGTYANPVIPTGTVKKYIGNVAEVDISRNLATFTINSYLELLNQNLPINLFQATCVNTLFDASCTLSQSNFLQTATAQSGSTNSTINTNLTDYTGYLNLGTITFTSGVNEGVSRTISTYTLNGSTNPVSVIAPFPSAPAAGDTFDVYPGCNKLVNQCATKFANLQNFRGFPFIPAVENAS